MRSSFSKKAGGRSQVKKKKKAKTTVESVISPPWSLAVEVK